jgi:hypothetical protein
MSFTKEAPTGYLKYYGPCGHGGRSRISIYFHEPAGCLFEINMDAGGWPAAKARSKNAAASSGAHCPPTTPTSGTATIPGSGLPAELQPPGRGRRLVPVPVINGSWP